MSTREDPLAAFLAARLDEDQAAADECVSINTWDNPPRWEYVPHNPDMPLAGEIRDRAPMGAAVVRVGHTWPREGRHIARHDPARVRADVAAKRAILDAYTSYGGDGDPHAYLHGHRDALHLAVQHLAAAYNTHLDYRPEYRP